MQKTQNFVKPLKSAHLARCLQPAAESGDLLDLLCLEINENETLSVRRRSRT